ncbi:unnamed protein product [Cunninghamella echinulata]
MEINSCFFKLNNDDITNTSTILEYIIEYLQKRKGIEGYGEAVSYSTRPWVLAFCSDLDSIELTIAQALTNKHHDFNLQSNKIWLEGIRLCVVKNLDELRAMLSSIHLTPPSPTETTSTSTMEANNKKINMEEDDHDLLTWIIKEKQGQPPSMVVVINLLELLLTYGPDGNISHENKYLYIRFDELAGILAMLTETCVYFSTSARETWEQPFGISTKTSTDLLITDNGCLRDITELQQQQEKEQEQQQQQGNKSSLSSSYEELDVLEKLHRIITYYLGNIV